MSPSLSFRGAKRRGNLLQPVTFSPGVTCYPTGSCEIATAPLGPRNDKSGGHCANEFVPQSLPACMAVTDRRYRRNRCAPFCRSPVRIAAVAPGGACSSPTRRLRSAKYPKNRSCPRGVEDAAPYKAPPILHKKLRDPCGPRRRFILLCRPARAAIFSAGRKTGHTR